MQPARLWEGLEDQKVQCYLCAHECKIDPDKRGICHVRQNQDGQLFSLNYGKVIAEHIDPIEKKPLFHFLPGTRSYSIATVGCNFMCLHCQNYDISQYPRVHGGLIRGDERTRRPSWPTPWPPIRPASPTLTPSPPSLWNTPRTWASWPTSRA